MADARTQEITTLLKAIHDGRPDAESDLISLVYEELRRIAYAQWSKLPTSASLQPTAVVHEAYFQLFGGDEPPDFENRAHFFCAAARVMRDLIIDKARARRRLKRGGDRERVPLADDLALVESQAERILELREALERLEQVDPRAAQVVLLHHFGGLRHADVAAVMGRAESSVRRDWRFAKAWLLQDLRGEEKVATAERP